MQKTGAANKPFLIYPLSESAITIEFGKEINEALSAQVSSLDRMIHFNPFPGFVTTAPAYATLTVFYNPLQVSTSASLSGLDCLERVSAYINNLKGSSPAGNDQSAPTITIPVCYSGAFGPDINEVARLNKLSVPEVIRLHSSAIYKVFMIGFVPGFAYLGGMPDVLASPRKQIPRNAVPAGSVGIAGTQTGIYPLQTPGGWQIIGQTPLKMFEATREQPALLKAGDRVVFKQIDESEFNSYSQ